MLKVAWALAICRAMTSTSGPLGDIHTTNLVKSGIRNAKTMLPLILKKLWARAVVAELLWSTAVTNAPASAPSTGFRVKKPGTRFMQSPATYCRPSLTLFIPYRNSARPPIGPNITVTVSFSGKTPISKYRPWRKRCVPHRIGVPPLRSPAAWKQPESRSAERWNPRWWR